MEPGQRMLPRLHDYYTDIMAINIERIRSDIKNINAFNATPGRGTTRLTFSAEYQGALNYVLSQFNQLAMPVIMLLGRRRQETEGNMVPTCVRNTTRNNYSLGETIP